MVDCKINLIIWTAYGWVVLVVCVSLFVVVATNKRDIKFEKYGFHFFLKFCPTYCIIYRHIYLLWSCPPSSMVTGHLVTSFPFLLQLLEIGVDAHHTNIGTLIFSIKASILHSYEHFPTIRQIELEIDRHHKHLIIDRHACRLALKHIYMILPPGTRW